MATKTPLLSVVINTKNSSATLKSCLDSVKRLADEIVVMDMQSQDNTVAIAKKYGAKIGSFKDVGYVEPARNAALKMATGQWILVLDADEEIPTSLARYIREELLTSPTHDAFFLPRKNIIFGKWVHTGWWPDYLLRLFRNGVVSWKDEIHAVPEVTGTIGRLEAKESLAITHHNYQNADQFIDRAQKYSKIIAKEKVAQKQVVEDPFEVFFDEVIRRFYAWEGNQDSVHGRMLSALQGVTKVFESVYAWEEKKYTPLKNVQDLSALFSHAAHQAKFWELSSKANSSQGIIKKYWKIRQKAHQLWAQL